LEENQRPTRARVSGAAFSGDWPQRLLCACRRNLSPCRGNHFFGKGKEKISRAKRFSGKTEDFSGLGKEKIGRAEESFGLFFLPPCLEKDFSGHLSQQNRALWFPVGLRNSLESGLECGLYPVKRS